MDRAWHLLNRAPRTKPQPHFPEPRRNKTHWDHLLEEMRWLAGDFVRERKFRAKLARKAAHAVARSNLDLESRVVKRAQDELIAARKTARNVANEVMHFWIKVEKVVRFKAQSAIDAKRNTIELEVDAAELERRRSRFEAPPLEATRGTLYKYIKNVKPASEGCVTDE